MKVSQNVSQNQSIRGELVKPKPLVALEGDSVGAAAAAEAEAEPME